MIDGIRRIGIYGGTFSPPHKGHVEAARAFMKQMRLDYLYVIPTAIPPHKQLESTVDARHRLRMCELAFADVEGVIVSDTEIRRGGISYTVDTLRELSAPDARLFLLCGTDMLLTLDKWREAEEIFRLCYPIYVRRENDPIVSARILSKITEYTERYNAVVRRVVVEPIEISSTEIRRRLASGERVGEFLPSAVEEYIRRNRLYGAE